MGKKEIYSELLNLPNHEITNVSREAKRSDSQSASFRRFVFQKRRMSSDSGPFQFGGRSVGKVQKWIESLEKEGISEFEKFVKMLQTKKEFIFNYVTNHLSHVVTEGVNNLVRYIKRFSFGMPNFQNLRWRVLDISS